MISVVDHRIGDPSSKLIGRSFVTGVSGFVGRHLESHLLAQGSAVIGQDRANGVDIRDRAAVATEMRQAAPDVVFHLASARRSAESHEVYEVAVLGTVAVLDAARQLRRRPRIVLVSSSAVYGPTPRASSVSEERPTRPNSHYGAAKLAQECIALAYAREADLDVVIARSFNLLGPGLPGELACGHFAAEIAKAEQLEGDGVLRTRGLSAVRDFTDVRDAVRALSLLGTQGESGETYNICSGTATTLRRCVDVLSGLAIKRIHVDTSEPTPDTDISWQVGDSTRLTSLTGWRASIPVEQSLSDMLDFERRRVQA
jgi:GDP-4-dehydro-6-deoxy-D-mannose reductase